MELDNQERLAVDVGGVSIGADAGERSSGRQTVRHVTVANDRAKVGVESGMVFFSAKTFSQKSCRAVALESLVCLVGLKK
jgi:hypothetical protein